MDYGPFGFVEFYDPLFAKWIGSGEHFAFMNQPTAALANFMTAAAALSARAETYAPIRFSPFLSLCHSRSVYL